MENKYFIFRIDWISKAENKPNGFYYNKFSQGWFEFGFRFKQVARGLNILWGKKNYERPKDILSPKQVFLKWKVERKLLEEGIYCLYVVNKATNKVLGVSEMEPKPTFAKIRLAQKAIRNQIKLNEFGQGMQRKTFLKLLKEKNAK
jgi:hypothetical protein